MSAQICYCGTAHDAIEAAFRILEQTRRNDECALWYVAVAEAMRVLAKMHLMEYLGVTADELEAHIKSGEPRSEKLDHASKSVDAKVFEIGELITDEFAENNGRCGIDFYRRVATGRMKAN